MAIFKRKLLLKVSSSKLLIGKVSPMVSIAAHTDYIKRLVTLLNL